MADICEICMNALEHYVDGIPNYEGIVLCSKCQEKVEEFEFDSSGKDFEECVEIIRKRHNKMTQKLVGLFDVLIEQKNTAEKSRLIGVDTIELLNNHILIYKKGKLVYKVWLRKEDYQELEQTLKDVGISIYKVK